MSYDICPLLTVRPVCCLSSCDGAFRPCSSASSTELKLQNMRRFLSQQHLGPIVLSLPKALELFGRRRAPQTGRLLLDPPAPRKTCPHGRNALRRYSTPTFCLLHVQLAHVHVYECSQWLYFTMYIVSPCITFRSNSNLRFLFSHATHIPPSRKSLYTAHTNNSPIVRCTCSTFSRPQQVHMLDLIVSRVRLTRDIPKYDRRLVTEACESGKDPMACRIMEADFKFPADGGTP